MFFYLFMIIIVLYHSDLYYLFLCVYVYVCNCYVQMCYIYLSRDGCVH